MQRIVVTRIIDTTNLLITSAIAYQTLAISYSDRGGNTSEPWEDDLDDRSCASGSALPRFSSLQVQLGLSSLLSDSLRGHYNRWKKCEVFFSMALGWLDRDFHSEFRALVCCSDHVVHLECSSPTSKWCYLDLKHSQCFPPTYFWAPCQGYNDNDRDLR